MKAILWLSTITAVLVFLYLLLSVSILPIMGVDAILTPDLIRQSTYEDRKEMVENIRRLMSPSVFHLSAIAFVCIANGLCLYLLNRKQK